MSDKVNDLSNSALKDKFSRREFVPETNFCVAMGRVSIKVNKDKGYSDEAQLEEIYKYVEKNKLALVREPWDVAETASKHERRKNFFELIDFVEASQKSKQPVKHVIFAYTSRGSRNKKSKRMIEELLDLGVSVHFIKDNLILHSMSDFGDLLNWEFKSLKDQEDIEKLRKHVWDGTVKRIENGLLPGKAPLGYLNYRATKSSESIFVIDEDTAPYVQRAFELFATGRLSVPKLVQQLKEEFPIYKVKVRHTSRRYVEQFLKNPFYYGDFRYDGKVYKGIHPPLISFDLWKQAQDAFKKRGWKIPCTKGHMVYTGLIRCGGQLLDESGKLTSEVCGCAVTGEVRRKFKKDGSFTDHIYWRCSNSAKRFSGKECSQRNVEYMRSIGRKVSYSQNELEQIVSRMFEPLNFPLEDVKWMQERLLEYHRSESQKLNQQLSALQDRYKMLKRYIDKAYEDKLNGLIPEDMWLQKNREWMLEQTDVEKQIRSISDHQQDYINKGVLLIGLAQATENIYKNADSEKKRKLVEVVSSDLVLKNGSIEFTYRKPFDLLSDSSGKDKWCPEEDLNLHTLAGTRP